MLDNSTPIPGPREARAPGNFLVIDDGDVYNYLNRKEAVERLAKYFLYCSRQGKKEETWQPIHIFKNGTLIFSCEQLKKYDDAEFYDFMDWDGYKAPNYVYCEDNEVDARLYVEDLVTDAIDLKNNILQEEAAHNEALRAAEEKRKEEERQAALRAAEDKEKQRRALYEELKKIYEPNNY